MKRRDMFQTATTGIVLGMVPWMRGAASTKTETKGNQMIIVTFEVEFEDDQIQDKREAIRMMDEATALEAGCIAYKSSFDANNPRILRIYEMWESMEALIPHFQTPHMTAFQAALSGLDSKNMEAKVFEVSRELPFPN